MITYLPGTTLPYSDNTNDAFSLFEPMLLATGGLALSQVCTITGLESTTIQNWVKRGWVAKPQGKKYHEVQLARILIISALRDSMQLEQIVKLMSYVNGSVEDRSDDIIKESLLYDYLCVCISHLDPDTDVSFGRINEVVNSVTKEYIGPANDSNLRIIKALTIMVLAYISAFIKKHSEIILNEIV